MNYERPELLDHLAATYVLGTLRGPARRRFAALARESATVQHAIWRWERKLLPLSDAVQSQTPPASVWSGIERRLGFSPEKVTRGWFWPTLSGALCLALIALALPLMQAPVPDMDSAAERLAYIQDDGQQPLWVVTVDEETGMLASVAVNAPAAEADRVFQLWMLPENGPPESFGLLPVTNRERAESTLSPTLLTLLRTASGLAVSIEPPGGSPTGAPTGPVVYTAPVVEL